MGALEKCASRRAPPRHRAAQFSAGSEENWLIRQLVGRGAARRGKMPLEQGGHPADGRLRAFGKAAGAVVCLHLATDGLPLRGADAGVDAAVSDDLDGTVGA